MTARIHYTQCPSCSSNHINTIFSARDYTVSQEAYELWHCNNCSLRFTQNIPDQDSIQYYYQSENYISHSDTNRGLVNQLYRIVRNFTLWGKRNIIRKESNLSKGNLLDVGAGTGAFVSHMQKAGWIVTGLEPDAQARNRAELLHSLQLRESSELFTMRTEHFDVITLWHVIEHVHALHPYFEQLKKLLKKSGLLFIAVPNYTSYDAEKYREFWAAYDVPRHLYHFSPASMKKLLQHHGLRIKNKANVV